MINPVKRNRTKFLDNLSCINNDIMNSLSCINNDKPNHETWT